MPRILLSISPVKPSMTASTTISVATPTAIPRVDSAAIMDTKPRRRRDSMYRLATRASTAMVMERRSAAQAGRCYRSEPSASSPLDTGESRVHGQFGLLAGGAVLQLHLTRGNAAGTDDDLPGQPDQVHVGELGAGALIALVVEWIQASRLELGIEIFAGFGASSVGGFQVDQPHAERRDRRWPNDTGIVMARLDDGANQTGHADAVRAHMDGHLPAIRLGDQGAQRLGVLVTEIEDVSDLNPFRRNPLFGGHLFEPCGIVLIVGCRIQAGKLVDDPLQAGPAVIVDVGADGIELKIALVAIHRALARLGQNDEFVAEIAADWTGIRLHGDRLQPHARVGAEIGDEHLVVGVARALKVQVEGIGVLHQELAASHHAEAGAHFVPELPLDVVEHPGELLVAVDAIAEDFGDHLLVRRTVEHLAIVTVFEAQHFLAVVVVAAGLLPEVGGLDGGHQHFLTAGPVLLFPHDLLDLLQHAEAERQPRINPGAGLADHPGAQHQAVRIDLRLAGILLQGGHEICG